MPALVICGSRGWRNEALFARLDASPMRGRLIFEVAGLGDGALAALTRDARAMLCPSFAEGFGLPAVEAARLGTPVACSDLPAFREVLGGFPVYLSACDLYGWSDFLEREMLHGPGHASRGRTRGECPEHTWEAHFDRVLTWV